MSDPTKTVFVTGANRGLGVAIASAFHEGGWRVIGTARRPESLDLAIIDDAHALDLSDPASLQAFAEAIIMADLVIDLLVNNAGFNPKDRKDDPDYFRSTFAIDNFFGRKRCREHVDQCSGPDRACVQVAAGPSRRRRDPKHFVLAWLNWRQDKRRSLRLCRIEGAAEHDDTRACLRMVRER